MMEFSESIGENSGVNVVYNHWVLGTIRRLQQRNGIAVVPTLMQEKEEWYRFSRCSDERKWVMSKLVARGVVSVRRVRCACTAAQPTGPYGD